MLSGGWHPRKRVDFCQAITQGACVAVCEEGAVALPRPLAVGRRGAVALALGAGALLAVRLDVPAFFDNEARYAEVAREMVLSGDWISPHLDFTLFLNKPPLVFWLAALVFRLAGPTEWARLVSVGAAMVALPATCRLGALLYGGTTGLVAGLALATSLGFVLEARTLRPDMILTATVVVALLCWQSAERGGARRARWLAGLYAALGVGVLAKGLVPLVLVGLPIAAVTLRDDGWRGAARLRPGLGLLVLAAIVVPWLVAGVGVAGLLAGRALLAQTYWLVQVPGLLALVAPAAAVVAGAGVLAALAALGRRPDWLVAALAASMVPLAAVVLRAEVLAEPLFSWRPAARALVAAVPREVEVVFEAPEEYQQVGGLAYYSERRITLLEPPGFVPPTYLAGHTREMFLARAAFERRWRAGERLAFVSDPQRRRDEPAALVPAPFYLLGHFGDRWVLTSFPAHAS